MGRILTRKDIEYTDQPNRLATAQEVTAKGFMCSDTGNKLTDNIKINVKWYASDEGTLDILGTSSYITRFTLYIESVYENTIESDVVSGGIQIPAFAATTVQASGAQYHVIQKEGENGIPTTLSNPRVETVNVGMLPASNSGTYHMRFRAQGVITGPTHYPLLPSDNISSLFKDFNSKLDVYDFINRNTIKIGSILSGNNIILRVYV